MTNKETLIKRYIANSLSEEEIHSLENIRKNEKETDLLLDIIDACKKKTQPKRKRPRRQQDLNQDDIEILLMRLLTFNIKKQDAAILLNQLYHTPRFLDKLKPALSIATTPFSNHVEDLIIMQSDDQILQRFLSSPKTKRKTAAQKAKESWKRFLDNLPIHENWIGGPAIAFASLILIFLTAHTMWNHPALTETYKTYFASDSAYLSRGLDAYNVPHSTLRGGGTDNSYAEESKHKLSIVTVKLDIAREYYKDKDFKDALDILSNLSPQMEALSDLPEAKEILSQFHFYYGMTYLGLAGQKVIFKPTIKKAIQHLQAADNFIFTDRGEHQDDVVFFLSYAYTLTGDEQTAARYAAMIPENSLFYKREP